MKTQELRTVEGRLVPQKLRAAIVAARENGAVASRLVEGAADCLLRHGASKEDILLAWVPGVGELPIAARRLAASGEYDAVLCLGAVIGRDRCERREAFKGVARVARKSDVPVLCGLVSARSVKRALERAGGKQGNRGFQCAAAAIETVDLLRRLDGKEPEPAQTPAFPGDALGVRARSLTALLDEDAERKQENTENPEK